MIQPMSISPAFFHPPAPSAGYVSASLATSTPYICLTFFCFRSFAQMDFLAWNTLSLIFTWLFVIQITTWIYLEKLSLTHQVMSYHIILYFLHSTDHYMTFFSCFSSLSSCLPSCPLSTFLLLFLFSSSEI